ncbi:MAG TPA: magnesium chelatase, partial [Yaniella sp.]
EIRTHYPEEIEDEIAVIRQEAQLTAEVPDVLLEILARFTRALRRSPAVNQASGVSARFAIAGAETIAAAARHRATLCGEEAVARPVDIHTAVEVLGGKIEFESGEEGREDAILNHLLLNAIAQTARAHFGGIDFAPLVDTFDGAHTVTTGEHVTAAEILAELPEEAEEGLYDEIADRLNAGDNPGLRAGAIELALEGLYLAQELSKDTVDGKTVYG